MAPQVTKSQVDKVGLALEIASLAVLNIFLAKNCFYTFSLEFLAD